MTYEMSVFVQGKETFGLFISNDTEFNTVVRQLQALRELNVSGKVIVEVKGADNV